MAVSRFLSFLIQQFQDIIKKFYKVLQADLDFNHISFLCEIDTYKSNFIQSFYIAQSVGSLINNLTSMDCN